MAQAQQNKIKASIKSSSNNHRRDKVTRLEQFSPEIFFEIFDYLTGNDIYTSFYGLNGRINELVYNTPNVHLNLSLTTTKFYRQFQQVFCEQNCVSVQLDGYKIDLLERLFHRPEIAQLKSITFVDLDLHIFREKIPPVLNSFKHKLVYLKLELTRMLCHGTIDQTIRSFTYILTELPMLKYLELGGSNDIDVIGHIDSAIINNTVISLKLSLNNYQNWIPILNHFAKLKMLILDFYSMNMRKRVASENDEVHFGNQISYVSIIDHPFRLRHIKVYQYNLILENVEALFRIFISPTLLTLSLFNCQRRKTRYPLPRRQPPFLVGTRWHDLVKTYLPPTMKRFYIEYEDVDNTMSLTNITQVEKLFMKYSGENVPWKVCCSYNKITKFLSFDFAFISVPTT